MARANGRRSIFITGAASGMGRATAFRFAAAGWFVGGFDVDEAGLASLSAEIGADDVLTDRLDVTDQAAFAHAVERFGAATDGRLDLMFNNAGIGTGGLFEEMPWDELMRVVNINLLGVMIGARATLPLLKATPGSLLLNNSSSSSIWGTAGIAVYSATKHAVRGLTEALTIEWQRHGVRVADLFPGLIDTPLLSDGMRAAAPSEGMWRLVQPAEIADTVLAAYGSDKLHWYVPDELKAFDRQAVEEPEAVREERTPLFAMMMAMQG